MNKNFMRQLAGLILFFNALIIIITGVVLFIMPHGRIAYWINWKLLGLNKDQWSDIHIISALLFIVAMFFHMALNWRAFLNYFSYKKLSPLVLASIITILAIVLTIYNLPPVKQIVYLEKSIKKSWETKDNHPPIPHAEKLSLAKLCKFANIPPKEALKKLREKGWKVISIKENVKKIAETNHHSPMELWHVINDKTKKLNNLESTL